MATVVARRSAKAGLSIALRSVASPTQGAIRDQVRFPQGRSSRRTDSGAEHDLEHAAAIVTSSNVCALFVDDRLPSDPFALAAIASCSRAVVLVASPPHSYEAEDWLRLQRTSLRIPEDVGGGTGYYLLIDGSARVFEPVVIDSEATLLADEYASVSRSAKLRKHVLWFARMLAENEASARACASVRAALGAARIEVPSALDETAARLARARAQMAREVLAMTRVVVDNTRAMEAATERLATLTTEPGVIGSSDLTN